jgi:cytochrome b6-f complex iron-sulfur subunit
MNERKTRRYIDDLLGGRRPKPFNPDDFEATQIRTAIDLAAARPDNDAPRPEFLADLQKRLAAQMEEPADNVTQLPQAPAGTTRRMVITATSAAAAAAAVAVAVDRFVVDKEGESPSSAEGELIPNEGSWHPVASSADVSDSGMHRFELGSLSGFIRRVDGTPEAVSGVCTHQGCKLWFDGPDDRLRCPCHLTSFSPAGQVLSHQLSISPAPLPKIQVREQGGNIEVFAPTEPV